MIGGLFKSASRVALIAAAGILAGGVAAQAADLGGNCCADLEERVAELEATTARKGNRVVSLTVYGQVNQAIVWHDDDLGHRDGKLQVRNNGQDTSKFGFRGEASIRPGFSVGYQIEIGLDEDFGQGSNSAKSNKSGPNDAFLIRHNYLWFNSETLGRVKIGQTSQVTDGLYEINLATARVTPGGMDEAEFVLHDHFVNTFATGFDGARRQGVYYNTPSLAGFTLGAGWSHGTQPDYAYGTDSDDFWEVALRYAGEFNGVRLAAGIGWRGSEGATGVDTDTYLGSASVMHMPTGLFVSGGYAKHDSDNDTADKKGYWVMAGIEKNWFGPGTTTLYGEYSAVDFRYNDLIGPDNHDGNYWGLGVVQKIDAAAMDLYVNFRNYKIDATGWDWNYEPSEDANVVHAGAIIKF